MLVKLFDLTLVLVVALIAQVAWILAISSFLDGAAALCVGATIIALGSTMVLDIAVYMFKSAKPSVSEGLLLTLSL